MVWPTKPRLEDTEERLTTRPERSVGRCGNAACMTRMGPRTLTLYWRVNSSGVISCKGMFLEMAALFMMMSIWNFPLRGWEKWFLALVIRWAGPLGLPMSAWTVRVLMPWELSREEASLAVMSDEESEV